MKNPFLLYEADGFLSLQSQYLLAVCSSKAYAIALAKKEAPRFMGEKLTKYERGLLNDINQTQGRTINYMIKEVQINTLI